MSIFTDQKDFMLACGQTCANGLNLETMLWKRLIHEEYLEVIEALGEFYHSPTLNQKANVAKEAIDLIYVAAGLLNNLNVPGDVLWAAVHKSNMAKVDPATGKVARRYDGKILKPEGWQPPDIFKILLETSPCE